MLVRRTAMDRNTFSFRSLLRAGENVALHLGAMVLGFILMVVGLGLGVTMVLLPIGIVVGLLGVLLFVGGLLVRFKAAS
jgi:hypothetical protein